MTLIYRAATIVLVGLVAAGLDSIRRPITVRAEAPVAPVTSAAPGGTAPAVPAALGLDITVPQAFDLFQKKAVFIDARSKADYEAGHVEGAFHLPVEAFSGNAVPEVVAFIDGNGPVVVYCTGGDCHASHDVVMGLQDVGRNQGSGFKQCHVMKDGFPAWQAAGHPIEAGPGPFGGGGGGSGGGQ